LEKNFLRSDDSETISQLNPLGSSSVSTFTPGPRGHLSNGCLSGVTRREVLGDGPFPNSYCEISVYGIEISRVADLFANSSKEKK
jgi:hypothetical protein